MKLFKIVEIGKFWEHDKYEIIEEDDIFIGRIMTEDRLRKGFEITLRDWDGSLENLNELFDKCEDMCIYMDREEKQSFKIVFESVGVEL